MQQIELPDGGLEVRFNITGRTRELVKLQAAHHGMNLQEWLNYCIERDISD
jgi:predicted DNA binding CopG/RHH family protein